MACFKVQSRNIPGGNKEEEEKLQLG
jgi:hypothetical protein